MNYIFLISLFAIFIIFISKNKKVENFIEDREDGHTYISTSIKNKDVNILDDVNIKKNLNVTQDVKILGKLLNKYNQDILPKGMIVMWGGDVNSIPTGWSLCDGTNGTPDLSGRFIASYVSNNKDWTVGPKNSTFNGIVKLNINNLPAHNHSGLTENTNINHDHNGITHHMNRNAAHSHHYTDVVWAEHGGPVGVPHNIGSRTGYDHDNGGWVRHVRTHNTDTNHQHGFRTAKMNGSVLHRHAIPSQGLNQAFDTRPNFYALAFIMKL